MDISIDETELCLFAAGLGWESWWQQAQGPTTLQWNEFRKQFSSYTIMFDEFCINLVEFPDMFFDLSDQFLVFVHYVLAISAILIDSIKSEIKFCIC